MQETAAVEFYQGLTLPILSFFQLAIFLAVLLPAAVLGGYAIARWQKSRWERSGRPVEVTGGETSLGAILALLGLILAFSFGNSLSSYQNRKQALLVEANALGTAFLRAEYLSGENARLLQRALLEYAKTRVIPEERLEGEAEVVSFLDTTLEAQAVLWPMTLEATRGEVPAAIQTFVAGAVNEVLDAHLIRMQTLATPVSEISQMMTLVIALIALSWLGYREGIRGHPMTQRTFVFSAMLWVVMLSIVDTQRGQSGFIRDEDNVLVTTIREMQLGVDR